jgi:hypothetical protein
MKRLDLTKPKYSHLFQVVIIFTNFMHRKHVDLTYEIIGDYNFDLTKHGLTIWGLLITYSKLP